MEALTPAYQNRFARRFFFKKEHKKLPLRPVTVKVGTLQRYTTWQEYNETCYRKEPLRGEQNKH